MHRLLRITLAFLWLTAGYWLFSTILPFALVLLPYASSGGGISMSSKQGVHQVRFSGSPGDLVLVVYVSDAGEVNLAHTTSGEPIRASSTMYQWSNVTAQLVFVALFALISIPLLRRLLRNAEPCAPPTGGPATQFGNSGAIEGPPSVS